MIVTAADRTEDDALPLADRLRALGLDWSPLAIDAAERALLRLGPVDAKSRARVHAALVNLGRQVAAGIMPETLDPPVVMRARRLDADPLGAAARRDAAAVLHPQGRTPERIDREAVLLLEDPQWRLDQQPTTAPAPAGRAPDSPSTPAPAALLFLEPTGDPHAEAPAHRG